MRRNWRGALGLLVTGALIWWLVARSHINWTAAWQATLHANRPLLALSVVVAMAMFPLRARRWRTLLDPVMPDLPFGPLWRSTAIGAMANNVTPGRLGELARAFALSKEVPGIPFSTSVASVGLDRIFDGLVVLLLMGLAVLDPRFPSGEGAGASVARAAVVPIVAVVVGFAGLYTLVFFPTATIGLVERVVRSVAPGVAKRVATVLSSFADGLGVLRSPRRFAAVLFWALLHWLAQPLSFWLGFRAFGIDGPWTMTLFVQGVIVVGVALPSSPGFVGVLELAAIKSLSIYGIGSDTAFAWIAAYHVLTFIPITLLGFYYFMRLGLRFSDIGTAERRP